MTLADTEKLISGMRVLQDSMSGNIYYVLQGVPYYEKEMKKRVKCGLGHNMWVNELNNIICEHRKCDARIKLTPYDR